MSNPFDNPFDNGETPPTLSVAQLNRQVKSLLESHFGFVWVEGEISNFAVPSSGHWYFSLKDGNAQVRCAMFRNRNQRVRFSPGSGDAVKIRARVSLYEGRGEFQLIVEHLEPAGSGALQLAFEKLKARLLAEGLFDEALKRDLPSSIKHVGVVTSPTGAAFHDILSVLARRAPSVQVSLLPVAVQGADAAPQIVRAIELANRWHSQGKVPLDVLIVGRGGGSLEDLWAFNEEIVARAVAASALPIVSAVGHEVDFSIADMAADVRAPTPSAAAELVSDDEAETLALLHSVEREMFSQMRRRLQVLGLALRNARLRLRHPGSLLREKAQRLDDVEQRLVRALRQRLTAQRARLTLVDSRLHARAPGKRIVQARTRLDRLEDNLVRMMSQRLLRTRHRLERHTSVLQSLSPTSILQRGYAILYDEHGAIVRRAVDSEEGEQLEAQLAEGRLGLRVTRVD